MSVHALKMNHSELSTGKSPQDEVRFLFAPIQVVRQLLDLPLSWSLASNVLHYENSMKWSADEESGAKKMERQRKV